MLAVAEPVPDRVQTKPRRDAELDGFRGIAVLLVVFYHGLEGMFPTGKVGVDVFFVLSGYLITGQLCKEYRNTGGIDKRRFYFKRSARLLPALIVAFLGMMLLGGIAEGLPRLKTLVRDAVFVFSYTANVPRALGYPFPDWFGHAWSLSIEWHFYLLWPLLVTWLARRYAGVRLARALAVLAVCSWLWVIGLLASGVGYKWIYNATDCRLSGLLVGAALSQFGLAPPPRMLGGRVRDMLLGCCCLVAILATSMVAFPVTAASTVGLSTLAIVAAAGVIRSRELLRGLLGNPLIVWVGSISYGFYLWHYPILRLFKGSWSAMPASPILGMLLALALAQFSFTFVETPILKLAGRMRYSAGNPGRPTSDAL